MGLTLPTSAAAIEAPPTRSAVAARLEPREATRVSTQAAATVTKAMSKTNDPSGLTALAKGLSAILGDGQRLERAGAVAATVGSLPNSQGPLGALALLLGLGVPAAPWADPVLALAALAGVLTIFNRARGALREAA